jgi:hypothetical protein
MEGRLMCPELLPLLDSVACPYAARAHVVCSPKWPRPEPSSRSVQSLEGNLRSFAHSAQEYGGDVLVLCIDSANALTVADWADFLHRLLIALRRGDKSTRRSLYDGLSDPGWDFVYFRTPFFISLFAPCYPGTHPRCSRASSTAFILFQPEHSFRRHGISNTRSRRRELSVAIRDRFARAGQAYDLHHIYDTPKSLRYIKPMGMFDSPIAWWQSQV